MESYKVVGLMSGTSLDGVDVAYCEFSFNKKWTFSLKQSTTIAYDEKWKKRLSEVHLHSAEELTITDFEFGNFLGEIAAKFCKENNLFPDFISSHGHTVFHQPKKGFTMQIGSGAHIAGRSGFSVVCDFRKKDVALGGQGAPLVPIGDRLLFSAFDFCLNLGGISNISLERDGHRIAFDISACNLVLNYYAEKEGSPFDKDGLLASRGIINQQLLEMLNGLPYYQQKPPKSLGREDVEKDILPLIESGNHNHVDALATFCEHIAIQIANVVNNEKTIGKMLITGGGTLNHFLMKAIAKYSKHECIIPERKIIEFKEAIIFAFLGVLRMRGEVNCLKSVTGASADHCGGAVYLK